MLGNNRYRGKSSPKVPKEDLRTQYRNQEDDGAQALTLQNLAYHNTGSPNVSSQIAPQGFISRGDNYQTVVSQDVNYQTVVSQDVNYHASAQGFTSQTADYHDYHPQNATYPLTDSYNQDYQTAGLQDRNNYTGYEQDQPSYQPDTSHNTSYGPAGFQDGNYQTGCSQNPPAYQATASRTFDYDNQSSLQNQNYQSANFHSRNDRIGYSPDHRSNQVITQEDRNYLAGYSSDHGSNKVITPEARYYQADNSPDYGSHQATTRNYNYSHNLEYGSSHLQNPNYQRDELQIRNYQDSNFQLPPNYQSSISQRNIYQPSHSRYRNLQTVNPQFAAPILQPPAIPQPVSIPQPTVVNRPNVVREERSEALEWENNGWTKKTKKIQKPLIPMSEITAKEYEVREERAAMEVEAHRKRAALLQQRNLELRTLGGITCLDGMPVDDSVEWTWDAKKELYFGTKKEIGVKKLETEEDVLAWEAEQRKLNPQFRGLRRSEMGAVGRAAGGGGGAVGGEKVVRGGVAVGGGGAGEVLDHDRFGAGRYMRGIYKPEEEKVNNGKDRAAGGEKGGVSVDYVSDRLEEMMRGGGGVKGEENKKPGGGEKSGGSGDYFQSKQEAAMAMRGGSKGGEESTKPGGAKTSKASGTYFQDKMEAFIRKREEDKKKLADTEMSGISGNHADAGGEMGGGVKGKEIANAGEEERKVEGNRTLKKKKSFFHPFR